jgi:hypothetical protein
VVRFDTDNQQVIGEMYRLLQQHSRDATLKCLRVEKGSIVLYLEGTSTGFDRLYGLYKSGELARLMGMEILEIASECYLLDGAEVSVVAPIRPLSLSVPGAKATVVCHAQFINGFEKEYGQALRLFSNAKSLPNYENCKVYITKKDGIFYVHSNFTKAGRTQTTKIATNETNDVLVLLMNLVYDGRPNSEETRRLMYAHQNIVQYFVDSKLMNEDGSIDIDLKGAREVIVVVYEEPGQEHSPQNSSQG